MDKTHEIYFLIKSQKVSLLRSFDVSDLWFDRTGYVASIF